MVFIKTVYQFPKQIYALQIGEHIQLQLAKVIEIFLNNIVTKSMKGINVYPICFGTNEVEQAFTHSHRTSFGIRKA